MTSSMFIFHRHVLSSDAILSIKNVPSFLKELSLSLSLLKKNKKALRGHNIPKWLFLSIF